MSYPKINLKLETEINQRDYFHYIKIVRSNTRKLSKLFSNSPKTINIYVFQNRVNFLKKIKKTKAPDWLTAYVPSRNTSRIYIFNNNEKPAKTKKNLQIVIHEITHLYTNTHNPNLPDWVKEGLSIYIAKQIFYPTVSKNDWKKITPSIIPFQRISWHTAAKYNGYNTAGLLTLFFIRRYGLKRFLVALRSYKHKESVFKTISNYFGEKNETFLINTFKHSFVK